MINLLKISLKIIYGTYFCSYEIIIATILAGCVSTPKNENRTFVEKLNGDNYSDKSTVLGIPVGARSAQVRKVSGSVYCGEGIERTQVNNAQIILKNGSKILVTTSTNLEGWYSLSIPVDTKAIYELHVQSSCGEKSISLSGAAVDAEDNRNFILERF
jgi:hypothetical protein